MCITTIEVKYEILGKLFGVGVDCTDSDFETTKEIDSYTRLDMFSLR